MSQTAQLPQPSPLELVRTGIDQAFFIFHSGFVDLAGGQTLPEERNIEEKAAERARSLAYVASTVAESFGIAQRVRKIDELPKIVEILGREALGGKLILEFHTHSDAKKRRSFPRLQDLGRAIADEIGKVDELKIISEEEAPFWVTDTTGGSSERSRISY